MHKSFSKYRSASRNPSRSQNTQPSLIGPFYAPTTASKRIEPPSRPSKCCHRPLASPPTPCSMTAGAASRPHVAPRCGQPLSTPYAVANPLEKLADIGIPTARVRRGRHETGATPRLGSAHCSRQARRHSGRRAEIVEVARARSLALGASIY